MRVLLLFFLVKWEWCFDLRCFFTGPITKACVLRVGKMSPSAKPGVTAKLGRGNSAHGRVNKLSQHRSSIPMRFPHCCTNHPQA